MKYLCLEVLRETLACQLEAGWSGMVLLTCLTVDLSVRITHFSSMASQAGSSASAHGSWVQEGKNGSSPSP